MSRARATVVLDGHIIDSLLLPKVLDTILAMGGTCDVTEVRIGTQREEPSHVKILVGAKSADALAAILRGIQPHGAVVEGETVRTVEPSPTSRLLVCPPDFFRIDYEINPWMKRENAVDHLRAVRQWDGLMEALERRVGVTLERMSPVRDLPDLVFTANAGVVLDGTAVPSRFRHPERQREQTYFESWFKEHGYEIQLLQDGVYFEGAGDLLGVPDLWLGGYRQRSDVGAYTQLSGIFGREIIPVELVDDRLYHLDTCFCPLSGGEVLYYPQAFDSYARAVIAERLEEHRRLAVPESEAMRFACNAVCVGRKVALPAGCPQTMGLLRDHGYEPVPLELDEFMKAGGSAKCLTLSLDS